MMTSSAFCVIYITAVISTIYYYSGAFKSWSATPYLSEQD